MWDRASDQTRPVPTSSRAIAQYRKDSTMFTVSQTAINAVVRDIQEMQQTGVVPDYIQQFYASRPDRQEPEEEPAQEAQVEMMQV
jgi:hypothetical protein